MFLVRGRPVYPLSRDKECNVDLLASIALDQYCQGNDPDQMPVNTPELIKSVLMDPLEASPVIYEV